MNCVVDRGNTKTKIYFFENDQLKENFSFFNENEKELFEKLNSYKSKHKLISSSSDVPAYFKENNYLVLSKKTPLPIKIDYKTPNTLGTDRIALAVGAATLFPNKNCLVISAGTCITYDLIDEKSVYQGGIISPGLTIRLQSLHTFTQNLPLIEYTNQTDFPLIGKSTKESMESGIYNGAIAEVAQIIKEFNLIYKDLTVIITGGDAKIFDLNIKNKIFAQQNIQAFGLNRILLYNA